MKDKQESKHLVMRFADSLCSGVDTIREHKRIIEAKGGVWLGKLGRPLSQHKINLLRKQIEHGATTVLYLVQRRGRQYAWTRATLADIAKSINADARRLVPEYYNEFGIRKQVSIWFKVSSLRKVASSEVRKIHVASSGRSILETLASSMAAMFMVVLGSRDQIARKVQPRHRKVDLHQAVLDAFEED